MNNVFEVLPSGFFNCLASGSNQRVYSDCLQIIYEQYDREISYRISRNRIRDALAVYLLENHVEYGDVEEDKEPGEQKNYNDLANAIIRRFSSKEVGWLEEDSDDATYEKHIMMTEQGIMLAEFLQQLRRPEREEYSSYIYHIYNLLRNEEQWADDPYVGGLKTVYRNAKALSGALKRLATFIKKIIERMTKEESLESLTENIIEYCDGDFIREYARLTKQQNIHIYRAFIRTKLEDMQSNEEMFALLVIGCALEEGLEEREAREQVLTMLQATKTFLSEDYDRIMRDIKHKITLYIQLAVGRARFIRNREADARGSIEQTIKWIAKEMKEMDWKEEMPEEINRLFALEQNEFMDTASLRFPKKARTVQKETFAPLEEMTKEDILRAKQAHEKEAYNPYAKELMKAYLEGLMGEEERLDSMKFPLESKRDLLSALSAVAYGEENGYSVRPMEGYRESGHMLMRRFAVVKEEKE